MKKVWVIFGFVLISVGLWADEASSFLFSGGAAIPFGPDYDKVDDPPYQPGVKIDGRIIQPIGQSPLNIHGQIGLNQVPFNGSDSDNTYLNLISIQAGPSLTMRPLERVSMDIAFQGGGFIGLLNGKVGSHGVVSTRADLNLQMGQSLLFGLGADYSYYMVEQGGSLDHTWSGLGVSVNLSYIGNSGPQRSQIQIQDIHILPIYPVLHGSYNDNKLGEITIRNGESRPVDNVAVVVYIPKYMSGPQSFQTGESLARGEVRTFPIHGLLDSSILEETEGTTVQAEVGVSYELRGSELTNISGSEAEVLYRNALAWSDDRRAASFVTSREPGIMEFSRNLVASVEEENSRELDNSLVNSILAFEALALYGFTYQVDPDSSYENLAGQREVLDYLQFPVETMTYRTGDCDDLSVLFCSIMESLSVDTAFITVPGHIFTAIALDMSIAEAQRTFSSGYNLIYSHDRAWIPVEATLLDGGTFNQAWDVGARLWKEAEELGQANLYPLRQSWELYPSVALNTMRERIIELPELQSINDRFRREISSLIERETAVQVEFLEKAIRESRGERRNRMINSLAVLKARYGLFSEAVDLLEPIAGSESFYIPGVINLANIHYRQGQLDTAWELYHSVLGEESSQPKAILGLILVEKERGNSSQVNHYFAQLEEAAPAIALNYEYLVNGSSTINRAGEAGQRERVLWEE